MENVHVVTTKEKMRIGIMGAASIAHKNAIAISHPESGCLVTAVASRSQAKVQDFVAQRGIPNLTTFSGPNAYHDLIQSDICDAIYIPLPTTLHKEWVLKTLQAKKHVLLEKPVALSADEFGEMLAEAYRQGKYIQDGTMFPHHTRTKQLLNTLATESIVGPVPPHRIETSFSFMADEDFHKNNIRVQAGGDKLGCIGDLGWYCIRMALLVFGNAGYGQAVSAQTLDWAVNSEGVPINVSCIVKFPQDRTLAFHCGFTSPFRMQLEICCQRKCVRMNDYVLPQVAPVSFTVESMALTPNDLITTRTVETIVTQAGPVQEVLMWKNFARIASEILPGGTVWGGDTGEEASRLARIAFANQAICDALMQSIEQEGAKISMIPKSGSDSSMS